MSSLINIKYDPPGPIGKAFMNSNAFVRGLRGPYGSGKSTCCSVEILRRASEQKPSPKDGIRRTRWAAIRNTFPELKTSTINTWHQWVKRDWGDWRDSGPPRHFIQGGDIELEILFLAMDKPDDINHLGGTEFTGAWINEAREVPKQILDTLTGRVGRFPSGVDGGCTWRGIMMDTNAPDAEHWWATMETRDISTDNGRELVNSMENSERQLRAMGMLGQEQKLFEFFKQPSGMSPDAENLNWLNQTAATLALPLDHEKRLNMGKVYYVLQMAGKKKEWTDIYVHNKYGFLGDGKSVWPDYRPEMHEADVEYSPLLGLHVGFDFGLTPAAVIFQRHVMGHLKVLSEVVTEDMGAKNFARVFKAHVNELYPNARFASITGDPAGDGRAQTDEETVFEMLASEGVIAQPAMTNDFSIRVEAVSELLTKIVDGTPRLLIGPRCHRLRKAMAGGYCYKRLNVSGEARYSDQPLKNRWSHVAEALQYGCLGAGEARALTIRPNSTNIGGEEIENGY